LYTKLRERGVRVEVLAFQDSLNRELVYHVDEVRLLGKHILFEQREVDDGSNERSAFESGN